MANAELSDSHADGPNPKRNIIFIRNLCGKQVNAISFLCSSSFRVLVLYPIPIVRFGALTRNERKATIVA